MLTNTYKYINTHICMYIFLCDFFSNSPDAKSYLIFFSITNCAPNASSLSLFMYFLTEFNFDITLIHFFLRYLNGKVVVLANTENTSRLLRHSKKKKKMQKKFFYRFFSFTKGWCCQAGVIGAFLSLCWSTEI